MKALSPILSPSVVFYFVMFVYVLAFEEPPMSTPKLCFYAISPSLVAFTEYVLWKKRRAKRA